MIHYDGETKRELKKDEKRLKAFLLATSLTLFCGTGSLLTSRAYANKNKKETEDEVTIQDSNEEFLKEFNRELDKNTELRESLDKFNVPYAELIKMYGDYLDKGALLSKASSLKIELDNMNDNITGTYNPVENKIYINKELFSENYNENNIEITETITHEFYHFLLLYDRKIEYIENGNIMEAFTELMADEAVNYQNEHTGYEYGMTYSRIFLDLLSKKACIFLAKGQPNYAIEELSRYVGRVDAMILLYEIDSDISYNYPNLESDMTDEEALYNEVDIISTISYIYSKKENKSINDNIELSNELNNLANYELTNKPKYVEKYFLNKDESYDNNPYIDDLSVKKR